MRGGENHLCRPISQLLLLHLVDDPLAKGDIKVCLMRCQHNAHCAYVGYMLVTWRAGGEGEITFADQILQFLLLLLVNDPLVKGDIKMRL